MGDNLGEGLAQEGRRQGVVLDSGLIVNPNQGLECTGPEVS